MAAHKIQNINEVAMDWKKYFIGMDHREEFLFIGTGEMKKDGTIKFKCKSGNKTVEIVNAVACLMRKKLNKNEKSWFGYDIPHAGKLVLIKPGYDFFVKKKPKSKITQPIMLE